MRRAGISGLPLRRRAKRVPAQKTVTDLVKRQFAADGPNRLWVTDITEHPTREGKVYCCVVIDVLIRRVVGWAIDTAQRSDLATNAMGMAIDSRRPPPGAIIHGEHGTQFTSRGLHLQGEERGPAPFPRYRRRSLRTRSWSRSGGACRSSCSTGSDGAPGSSSRTRSSSTSRGSTTAADATVRSAGLPR
jgi:transposase InsO family protein